MSARRSWSSGLSNTKTGVHKGWREYAYGITSLSAEQADAEQLLKDNRGHWSIESVHYMLDWDFDEDRSRRIRTGHGPENMTRLRRFAIGLLKSKQKRYETVREQMLRLNRMPRVVLDYLKLTGNTALRNAAVTATAGARLITPAALRRHAIRCPAATAAGFGVARIRRIAMFFKISMPNRSHGCRIAPAMPKITTQRSESR